MKETDKDVFLIVDQVG